MVTVVCVKHEFVCVGLQDRVLWLIINPQINPIIDRGPNCVTVEIDIDMYMYRFPFMMDRQIGLSDARNVSHRSTVPSDDR